MARRARGANRYGFRTRALPSAAAALVFAAILSALLAFGVTSAFFTRLRPSLAAGTDEGGFLLSAGLLFFCALFPASFAGLRAWGVRRGLFAPFCLVRRDPLLPQCDMELWCSCAEALWAASSFPRESWPAFAGARRGPGRDLVMLRCLRKSWDVDDAPGGLAEIARTAERWRGAIPSSQAAWELCRALVLASLLFETGILTRSEANRALSETALVLQSVFPSWEDYCENYLDGYASWQFRSRPRAEASKNVAACTERYRELLSRNPSPFSVPWDTPLRWYADEECAREETERVLRGF